MGSVKSWGQVFPCHIVFYKELGGIEMGEESVSLSVTYLYMLDLSDGKANK